MEPSAHRDQSGALSGPLLTWIVIITAAGIAVGLNLASRDLLGFVAIAMGYWFFVFSGGRVIDALSVTGMGSILFVGFAYLIMPEPFKSDNPYLTVAVLLGLVGQLGVVAIAWHLRFQTRSPKSPPLALSGAALLIIGCAMFALGLVVRQIPVASTLAAGFFFVAPLLATLGAASLGKYRVVALLVPLSLVGLWMGSWAGGGRIVALSLLLGCVMVYQSRLPPRCRCLKVVLPLLLVPGLYIAGLIESQRAPNQPLVLAIPQDFSFGDSVSSLWSPLVLLADMINKIENAQLAYHGLDSYLASLVALAPRQFWPNKPEGYGRVLAWEFSPETAAVSNQSVAALAQSEALWAFGWLGVVAWIPIAGLLLGYLNHKISSVSRLSQVPGRGFPVTVVWVICAINLLSYWWAGSFSYSARTMTSLAALSLVIMPIWLLRRVGQLKRVSL